MWPYVILGLILAGAAAYVIVRARKRLAGKGGCSCGPSPACSGCPTPPPACTDKKNIRK